VTVNVGGLIMRELFLNANTLPEPLLKLIHSEKIRVRESNGVITMSPVEEEIDCIKSLRGCRSNGRLTVEKFLAITREDIELES
jgi:hypothetical protein